MPCVYSMRAVKQQWVFEKTGSEATPWFLSLSALHFHPQMEIKSWKVWLLTHKTQHSHKQTKTWSVTHTYTLMWKWRWFIEPFCAVEDSGNSSPVDFNYCPQEEEVGAVTSVLSNRNSWPKTQWFSGWFKDQCVCSRKDLQQLYNIHFHCSSHIHQPTSSSPH